MFKGTGTFGFAIVSTAGATLAVVLALGSQVFSQTYSLRAGESIQAAVNNHPSGTTFFIAAGVYRQQSIVPKDGDTFVASTGTVLNGAVVLSNWNQNSVTKRWTSHVNVTAPSSRPGVCDSNHPMCRFPQDLFFDNVLFRRVASLSVLAAGKWYLDYSTGTVYLVNDPIGHTVEMSRTTFAFSGASDHVTIRGFIIQKYANLAHSGAINAYAPNGAQGKYWLIENNEIRYNHGAGISASSNAQVLSNWVHHNGEIGMTAGGSNILIQNNRFAYNNTVGYTFGEAGGVKIFRASYVTVNSNYAHDNLGPGFHTDLESSHIIYEHNTTSNNRVAGIMHEISYSAVIRYNTVSNDGYTPYGSGMAWGAGIFNLSSANVEVYGNTVTNCMNGITAAQYPPRISSSGTLYLVKNYNVHDNFVTQKSGHAAGIVKTSQYTNSIYTSWGNSYRNNSYTLPALSGLFFHWTDKDLTRAGWNAYGEF